MPRAFVFLTHRSMMSELGAPLAERVARVLLLQGLVPDVPPVGSPLDIDLALLGSALDRPYAERCEIPAERQAVLGYPDYDSFAALDRSAARQALAQHAPQAARAPVVLFLSQYATEVFPDQARRTNLTALLETARLLPRVQFVVKPHPRREPGLSRRPEEWPENVSVVSGLDAPTLLSAADVACTYWSTTALEALLLDVPLVQLNATGLPDFLDFSAALRQPTCRSGAELARALEPLLTSPEARSEASTLRAAFLASRDLRLDGQAAARAADAIVALLAARRGSALGPHGSSP
jgi:CDP-glycerol glycerophosphotransferase (TagB/SpsB family)